MANNSGLHAAAHGSSALFFLADVLLWPGPALSPPTRGCFFLVATGFLPGRPRRLASIASVRALCAGGQFQECGAAARCAGCLLGGALLATRQDSAEPHGFRMSDGPIHLAALGRSRPATVKRDKRFLPSGGAPRRRRGDWGVRPPNSESTLCSTAAIRRNGNGAKRGTKGPSAKSLIPKS